ncbi:alpha/beta-hydrolase [Mycena rebaudengoi]|nr:alpha/beta-hydrolase [Mycena rebaudengoi]
MSPSLTTKRLISKDGTEILAEATGNYAKPHIVFVHGFGCTGAAFDPIFNLDVLTVNLYMVRYDTRGHGRSGKPQRPEDYESIHYAEDFQAVLDGFKLNKPIFAGWSLGANVLTDICAYLNPLPVSAAIWISPHVFLDEAPPAGKHPGLLSSDVSTALQARIDFCANFVAPGCEVPFADMLSWVGAAAYFPPSCMALVIFRQQDTASLKKSATVGLPLFFIYGTQDLLVPCDKVAEKMKPVFTDMEIAVMEGIGHIPFWEDPKLFAEHIMRFVKRIFAE